MTVPSMIWELEPPQHCCSGSASRYPKPGRATDARVIDPLTGRSGMGRTPDSSPFPNRTGTARPGLGAHPPDPGICIQRSGVRVSGKAGAVELSTQQSFVVPTEGRNLRIAGDGRGSASLVRWNEKADSYSTPKDADLQPRTCSPMVGITPNPIPNQLKCNENRRFDVIPKRSSAVTLCGSRFSPQVIAAHGSFSRFHCSLAPFFAKSVTPPCDLNHSHFAHPIVPLNCLWGFIAAAEGGKS